MELSLCPSLNRGGRWCTTDDFATSFLHLSLFSTALCSLGNLRPVHSEERLVIVLHPMLTVPSWSSKASVAMLSKNMLKRDESRHLRRTRNVVRNQSPMLPLKNIVLVAVSQRCLMTRIRLALMLYFFMVVHCCPQRCMPNPVEGLLDVYEDMVEVFPVLRYFSHSMRRLKICSVVLLPALKPACSSAMIFSVCGFNLFSMTFSMTFSCRRQNIPEMLPQAHKVTVSRSHISFNPFTL